MYKTMEAGDAFVINGVVNPMLNIVDEPEKLKETSRFVCFYFKDNSDNLNYLLNEIKGLKDANTDCYFIVCLSNE